jgi:transcriptional regulator of heat shock response
MHDPSLRTRVSSRRDYASISNPLTGLLTALYLYPMEDRSAEILEAVIQEFINGGEPVSSGRLYERHDFGIKPAMIRLELDALEDAGYLEQPHHSAGRVPTDSGYEFFAKQMLGSVPESRENRLKELFMERAWPDLLRELSEELGMLSVIADLSREMVYKAGLEQLIKNLDYEGREEMNAVIHDFETMDARLPHAAEKMREGPNVFIGKKSPVTKSENLSVVGGNFIIDGVTITIFAIGPKRMDYKKTIRIFKSL